MLSVIVLAMRGREKHPPWKTFTIMLVALTKKGFLLLSVCKVDLSIDCLYTHIFESTYISYMILYVVAFWGGGEAEYLLYSHVFMLELNMWC